jgi:pentatricopeptide repeat protein
MDIATYDLIMQAYISNNEWQNTLKIFQHLVTANIAPDSKTLLYVLQAYRGLKMTNEAIVLLQTMLRRFNVALESTHVDCVVGMLREEGKDKDAETLIKELQQ